MTGQSEEVKAEREKKENRENGPGAADTDLGAGRLYKVNGRWGMFICQIVCRSVQDQGALPTERPGEKREMNTSKQPDERRALAA